MVAACDEGKDVYCEKPLGRTIEECNLMLSTAKRNKTVVQVGQWQRSDPHWLDAVNFIQSGKLGKIRLIRVFSYQGWCPSIPVRPMSLFPRELITICGWDRLPNVRSIVTVSILHSDGSGIMLAD